MGVGPIWRDMGPPLGTLVRTLGHLVKKGIRLKKKKVRIGSRSTLNAGKSPYLGKILFFFWGGGKESWKCSFVFKTLFRFEIAKVGRRILIWGICAVIFGGQRWHQLGSAAQKPGIVYLRWVPAALTMVVWEGEDSRLNSPSAYSEERTKYRKRSGS